MAFNIFGTKKEEKKPAQPEEQAQESVGSSVAPVAPSHGAHQVIESFYVSEKASRLMGNNQYMFKVAKGANKQSIAQHVSKLYNVKVINVQVLNMPEKSRNVGRHSGTKPGFRKAIVTLAPGNTIQQAKP